jgi:hypothetical protein
MLVIALADFVYVAKEQYGSGHDRLLAATGRASKLSNTSNYIKINLHIPCFGFGAENRGQLPGPSLKL